MHADYLLGGLGLSSVSFEMYEERGWLIDYTSVNSCMDKHLIRHITIC